MSYGTVTARIHRQPAQDGHPVREHGAMSQLQTLARTVRPERVPETRQFEAWSRSLGYEELLTPVLGYGAVAPRARDRRRAALE